MAARARLPGRRDHRLDRARPRSRTSPARLLPLRVHASPENFNTEIGLPLAILAAPPETEALVLEMAMRGLGQIAELCEIAEPDVGGDHQRRPRAPRAAGHAGGDRRGEGRDPRRARRDGAAAVSRRTRRRSSPTSTTASRRSPSAPAATSSPTTSEVADGGRPRRRAHAGRRGDASSFPFTEAHNLHNALARDRDRGRAGVRPLDRDGASGAGDSASRACAGSSSSSPAGS